MLAIIVCRLKVPVYTFLNLSFYKSYISTIFCHNCVKMIFTLSVFTFFLVLKYFLLDLTVTLHVFNLH